MYSSKEIQDIVNQKFNEVKWVSEPIGLYAPISYVLSLGGKRVRPTLALMATNLFSENITEAINLAIGIEVYHNFTLLHDDIMDKAPLRRNKPTVHVKWNENTAILSGDAMLIKAYEYVGKISPENLSKVLPTFSQTALEVCEGQQYDMDFEDRTAVSEDEYLEMIRLKTAVLLAGSLKMGALIGGANEDDAKYLYDFGINIGLAFQLMDDLLDVYGNPESFGKQIGGDILCNKKTYLLINAINESDDSQKDALEYWLNQDGAENPHAKVQAVKELYNQIGVKTLCEDKMEEYYKKAMDSLDKVSVSPEKKYHLTTLAQQLMYREV